MKLNRAVFFDRDGVLIDAIIKDKKPYSIRYFNSIKIKKNIKKVINTIKKKNFLAFMITNQPDVNRGLTDKKEVIKKSYINPHNLCDNQTIFPFEELYLTSLNFLADN